MMHTLTGYIIKASPSMNDAVFTGAIVFITEHNDNGATGFIINKAFGSNLNELEEFKHSKAVPLYDGGPVGKEHLYFLHIRPDVIEEGKAIVNGIYFGGNFNEAVNALNDNAIEPAHLKIFIGYCGWDSGELEAEMAEGSWIVTGTAEHKDVLKQYV